MNNLDFMKKFKPEKTCLKEFKYWIVCLREKQATLGAAVILLKRETNSLGNVLPEEATEFPKVIKWYEETCQKKFSPIVFNYIILMFNDKFVHYHALPRYDKEINLFGMTWQDIDYPRMVNLKRDGPLDEAKLIEIKKYMQN